MSFVALKNCLRLAGAIALLSVVVLMVSACAQTPIVQTTSDTDKMSNMVVSDKMVAGPEAVNTEATEVTPASGPSAEKIRALLDISEDYRSSFVHGPKPVTYQKYIVLHDTEGSGSASSVVNYWDNSGNGVAAHFIINKDGSIVQCVPLDSITHHAGFGDTGHNDAFGIEEDGRDDMVGTVPIGGWASDYGMNAWSVGIEIVHIGGEGYYPEAQLEALDNLIAYIDAYYGFESAITDHKAWRTGNSDTSPEFAEYLANYKDHRTHN